MCLDIGLMVKKQPIATLFGNTMMGLLKALRACTKHESLSPETTNRLKDKRHELQLPQGEGLEAQSSAEPRFKIQGTIVE
jgi:hypothetical protein